MILDGLRKGFRALDVGAATGDKTFEMIRAGASFVVAVDPLPFHVHWLKFRATVVENVAVEACALGSETGSVTLHVCRDTPTISTVTERFRNPWGRFVQHGQVWPDKIQVPVRTLDEMVAQYGPFDFIKIDVEGFEREVLAGFTSITPLLCFEFHQELIGEAEACISRLLELGYFQFAVSDAETDRFSQQWCNATQVWDFLNGRGDGPEEIWGWWGDIYAKP